MDITRAIQAAVRSYQHGTASLAAAMDMSGTTLSHKASPTYPMQFCSPEEMLQIMEITGNDAPLIALAAARNYALLPIAQDLAVADSCAEAVVTSMREFAAFVTEITADSADDAITANEMARIEREALDAIASIQRTVAWAAAKHASARPAHLRSA